VLLICTGAGITPAVAVADRWAGRQAGKRKRRREKREAENKT